ncbi:hypothetical protein CVT91_06675 [Candidatus Atribacteria bacterium HGW-Atribacteria-1]|nr:MAG: hypothetical protein CVT91_06675 [Candidatus Atribacteria bacterium HGW-Atribacteria-1]
MNNPGNNEELKNILEKIKSDNYVREILSEEKLIDCKDVELLSAKGWYSEFAFLWATNPGWGMIPGEKYVIKTEKHIIFLDRGEIARIKFISVIATILGLVIIILLKSIFLFFGIFFIIIGLLHGYYGFRRKFEVSVWDKNAIKEINNEISISGKLLNRWGNLKIMIRYK